MHQIFQKQTLYRGILGLNYTYIIHFALNMLEPGRGLSTENLTIKLNPSLPFLLPAFLPALLPSCLDVNVHIALQIEGV